jgi:serine phosphatase RsbU (regulator of sigma subunit)
LRILGFPHGERYRDPARRQSDLLKVPDEVDWSLASAASRAFAERNARGDAGAVRFKTGGEPWWGDGQRFQLGVDRTLWIFVFAPEEELLFGIKHLRWWQLGVGLIVTLIAVAQAIAMARRFSRPVETLVEQSDRIGQGMLDEPARMRSRITEIRRLGNAQERMRKALKSLLRIERDLQVARSIQQQTFPKSLPKLRGFRLAAWSNPADETGGDTYDVIGYRRATAAKPILPANEADLAVFLLADATGHGIGPALIVTQIRAMLRMAIRMGEDLETLARHINAQLCADLLDGRFITAWLAEVDAERSMLRSFSAGQGPIALYRAGQDTVRFSDADAPPFGVLEDLPIQIPAPVTLEPGDVVLVASDGIYEAASRSGEQYGQGRVEAILREHHARPAEAILEALRADLARFTAGTRPSDDQTVVVIQRTG